MPSSGSARGPSRWIIVLAVLFAIASIQGYFFLKNKYLKPSQSPAAVERPVAGKPLKKPAKTGQERPLRKPGEVVGRIAIVIDDWGYNNSHCKYLAAMPASVGVAILPGLQYSRDIVRCAAENGKLAMLHLPLEPYNHKEMFKDGYVLTTQMDQAELRKTLARIMDEMKGVIGVNNHTGSKGSESELVMTTVLSEVKRRGLFFVDSVTSDHTLGGVVASKLKMRIARRDVFLDNRNERAAIERQFAETAKVARMNGYALAIGHDRALSLQIIIEQMKKLSEQGYQFISVTDYIKKNEYPRH